MAMRRTPDFAAAAALLTLAFFLTSPADAKGRRTWRAGHATFYGSAQGTIGGGCGFGEDAQAGYGMYTTALSTVLFNQGTSCGSCFEVRCDFLSDSKWCIRNTSVVVTATDLCPPDFSKPNDNGGWCNPPLVHFDLAVPAFTRIAVYDAGIVPILFRRVPCARNGGVRFTMKGNRFYNLVLITNVGGAGALAQVWVKGDDSEWMQMTRNWGGNWQTPSSLYGQSLSFRLVGFNGHTTVIPRAVPSGWGFSQTYEASKITQL